MLLSSRSPSPGRPTSYPDVDDTQHDLKLRQELEDFILELSQDPDREIVASEIQVLQSIYGDDVVRLWHPPVNRNRSPNNTSNVKNDSTIRYEVVLDLPSPHSSTTIKLLVSLPPTYPKSSPPQLQLLSRYIGPFGADSALFGSILRTYISRVHGVEWSEDTLCVFDGLQNVLDRCMAWYEERLSTEKVGDIIREETKESEGSEMKRNIDTDGTNLPNKDVANHNHDSGLLPVLPVGIDIFVAEPIIDRKSSFVGRACRINHPSEVPLVLSHLMSDRRIGRAAHPIINAWRCQVDGVLHQDNDDDGETAAGGRLAHLLQILDVNNVLIIVTRYFGGIHLGPDRFKHINQAARNALDLGGFLDAPETKKHSGRASSKKH